MPPRTLHPNQEAAFQDIEKIEAALNELIEKLKEHPEFNIHAFYTAEYQLTTGFMWLKRGVDQHS